MATRRRPTTRRTSSGRADLARYEDKRDFSQTPEPSAAPKQRNEHQDGSSHPDGPDVKKTPAPSALFVVQKHDARRLHYDVRLQVDDVLVSWAVPKGPTYDPHTKRLAVHVEDHPLDYASFEGRIPEGNYGAGDVLVWDRGTFTLADNGFDLKAMLAKGHVHVILHGDKLKGGWHFVRTRDEKVWLFFKAQDAYANASFDVTGDRPESVVSGNVATRPPERRGPSVDRAAGAAALARSVGEVARATSIRLLGPPSEYLFEVKYDGYRLLAAKVGEDVRLVSRAGHDWTDRFSAIAKAVAKLPVGEVVLDGEACVVDEQGRPSFESLQRHLSGDRDVGTLVFPVFDILWLEGRDMRSLPLEERRRVAESIAAKGPHPVSFSGAIQGELGSILEAARSAGLEGLVAKRKGSAYIPGPTSAWIKLKFELRQDCVVCGYTPMSGTNVVGALILGLYDAEGRFVYAGKVGTGMNDALRAELAHKLDAARIPKCPLAEKPPIPDARWAEPSIVIEIGLREWSRSGSPRFPRFLGFRDDKSPRECVRESTDSFVDTTHAPRGTRSSRKEEPAKELAPGQAPAIAVATIPVKLSNADKILYPNDGITKRDIYDYYTDIAPVMLPHLRGRPVNLQRWPDGIHAQEWFQHAAPPKAPPFVRQLPFDRDPDSAVEKNERQKWRVMVENVQTLQFLANLAALTIHQRSSHLPPDAVSDEAIARALASPDYVLIDLDPGEGPFTDVVRVALAVKTLLDALSLTSVVKTTGSRGLHVFVPLSPGHTHDDALAFASEVARAVAKVLPDIATVETRKDKRRGLLYVDAGQNGRGRTVAAPYTLRARDGAPVSAPLEWSEVNESLDPKAFNLRTMRARVEAKGDLLAPLLSGKNILPRVRV